MPATRNRDVQISRTRVVDHATYIIDRMNRNNLGHVRGVQPRVNIVYNGRVSIHTNIVRDDEAGR